MNSESIRCHYENIRNLLIEIAKHENLVVSIKKSVYGGLAAGFGGILGGVLMGSKGVALGSLLGGFLYSWKTDNYYPVWKVLSEISANDLMSLILAVDKIIFETVPGITCSIVKLNNLGEFAKECIVKEICAYMSQEMQLVVS